MAMEWSIHWITALVGLTLFWAEAECALSGWSDSPTQYHVQTDEGPDRFFRFQTFNGQYRRERRMDDGTVIGSYGWVDPSGYLRMTDYVADSAGYRVVKSRTEFVGVKPQPVEERKPYYRPMKHSTRVIRPRHSPTEFAQKLPSEESPKKVLLEAPTTTPAPSSTTIRPEASNTRYEAPRKPVKRIIRVYGRKGAGQAALKALENKPEGEVVTQPGNHSNRPYIIQYSPKTGESGNDVFRTYATPLRRGTGFIYKIPTQYHKEETEADGSRVGSFGYVDPFGIRRVIHYNAGKTGFDHQVDFKYVGKQPAA